MESLQNQIVKLRENKERLESDLESEIKLKMCLLNALSETKKIVEQQQVQLDNRDREIALQQERMAHFVNNLYGGGGVGGGGGGGQLSQLNMAGPVSSQRLTPTSLTSAMTNTSLQPSSSAIQQQQQQQQSQQQHPFLWAKADDGSLSNAPQEMVHVGEFLLNGN